MAETSLPRVSNKAPEKLDLDELLADIDACKARLEALRCRLGRKDMQERLGKIRDSALMKAAVDPSKASFTLIKDGELSTKIVNALRGCGKMHWEDLRDLPSIDEVLRYPNLGIKGRTEIIYGLRDRGMSFNR